MANVFSQHLTEGMALNVASFCPALTLLMILTSHSMKPP